MNLSSDLLLFDGAVPVTLRTARPDGQQQTAIAGALPRPVERSEADSALVVLARETRDWLLPANALPVDLEPQPGDEIVDGLARWLILSTRRGVLGTVWRCTCRRRE